MHVIILYMLTSPSISVMISISSCLLCSSMEFGIHVCVACDQYRNNCNPIELWNLCCTKVVTWMGGHSLFTWLDVVISMLHVWWQCRWYNLTTLLVWMVELLYLNGMLTSSCAWLSLTLSLIIKGYMYCMQHHALSQVIKTLHLYEANTRDMLGICYWFLCCLQLCIVDECSQIVNDRASCHIL